MRNLTFPLKKHNCQNEIYLSFVSLKGLIGDILCSFCFLFPSETMRHCEKHAAALRRLAAGPTFLLTAGVINAKDAGAILRNKTHKSLLERVKTQHLTNLRPTPVISRIVARPPLPVLGGFLFTFIQSKVCPCPACCPSSPPLSCSCVVCGSP